MNLIIDKEFQALIPALTEAERDQLEKSLRANGCIDPIRVWDGHNIIIDGHNRYEICTRRNIEFKVTEIYMRDRETVKQWMILNQLGRRNLSPDAASLLRGMLYNAAKKAVGKPQGTILGQIDPITTAETIAAQTGVSPATAKRDGKFAEQGGDHGSGAKGQEHSPHLGGLSFWRCRTTRPVARKRMSDEAKLRKVRKIPYPTQSRDEVAKAFDVNPQPARRKDRPDFGSK